MKTRILLPALALIAMVSFYSCKRENKELKADAEKIAAIMCKSLESMRALKSANPNDTVKLVTLQAEVEKTQTEMTVLYDDFHKKYGEKAKTAEFGKEFRKYLNEAMLDCKSLSKEDRALFEKDLE
ncbi:MAG TPA: hypothetical protein PKG48_00610 [Bacteroidales bacterium]|nr:hypothetical protein [Bacteroidales bacterium]